MNNSTDANMDSVLIHFEIDILYELLSSRRLHLMHSIPDGITGCRAMFKGIRRMLRQTTQMMKKHSFI